MKLTQSLCVHSIAEASCNACVDVCPTRAISFSDGSLNLDLSSCDDCGLCVGICPQHVLKNNWEKELEQVTASACYISCEYAQVKGYGINIPCIYSIHLETLAHLVAQGINKINLNAADCAKCQRKQKNSTLEVINEILTSYPKKQIKLNYISIKSTKDLTIDQPNLSRRFLFRSVKNLVDENKTLIDNLALDKSKDKLPFVPEIDELKCYACHACSRICPHKAITFDNEGPKTSYQIFPENCNNCGLCQDNCDVNAISIIKSHIFKQEFVQLSSLRCKQCGNDFFITEISEDKEICKICQSIPKRSDRVVIKD